METVRLGKLRVALLVTFEALLVPFAIFNTLVEESAHQRPDSESETR